MDTPPPTRRSRKEVAPVFAGVMIGAVALYLIMTALQPQLMDNHLLPDFLTLLNGCMNKDAASFVYWFFEDLAESNFIASMPAALGLIIGGFIAAYLERTGSKHAGPGVDGNGHVFTAMFFTSALGAAVSLVVFGGLFPGFTGWIPTFAVILIASPMIIHFGASAAKLATTFIVSTLTTFPVAYVIITYVAIPLGFPPFLGVSITITLLVPLLTLVIKNLPWMAREEKPAPAGEPPLHDASPVRFFLHRVFGDIGELPVYGSSWAAVGLLIGTIVAWAMNPLEPGYGAGNVPLLLASQIAVAALAIFIYYPKWRAEGWAFTFPGIVLVSAIVGKYAVSGTPVDIVVAVLTIIVGAVVFVPLIEKVQKLVHYQGQYHVIGTIQGSIFPVVIVWSLILMYVVLPLLD